MAGSLRIGVDVGGTNTDAVLLRDREVLAQHKAPTSSDVETGVVAAIREVLSRGETSPSAISAIMIGTTHFTNAFIEGRCLAPVGVLRLGAPRHLECAPVCWLAHEP